MKLYPAILQRMILPLTDCVMGTTYAHYAREFFWLDRATREEIVVWQNRRLHTFMEHVYNHVPFYREFMNENKLNPTDIRCAEDLRVFPELNKQVIKENYDRLIPENLRHIKHTMSATGGSTGEPLKYFLSYETQSAMWAKRICVLRKYGFYVGEKYLALGSSSIVPGARSSTASSVFHKLVRMAPLNAANMDETKCLAAIGLLRRNRIRMIYGYASAIYLLAKYILDHQVDLQIDVCVTTSEKLTEHYETTIKAAFGCCVINEYGAREAGLYSYRCEDGRFHMIETCLFGLSGGARGSGSVITTSLINHAMPLINYNVGDIITTYEGECGCGSSSFAFENVIGRESQVMTLTNGRTITGPAFTVLFSRLPVKCYQIAKTGDCAIEVRIQRGEGYADDTERLILKSLKTHAGEDCAIAFNYCYEFIPLKNGKRDYFVTG